MSSRNRFSKTKTKQKETHVFENVTPVNKSVAGRNGGVSQGVGGRICNSGWKGVAYQGISNHGNEAMLICVEKSPVSFSAMAGGLVSGSP